MNCETLVVGQAREVFTQLLELILSRQGFGFLLVTSCDLGELGS